MSIFLYTGVFWAEPNKERTKELGLFWAAGLLKLLFQMGATQVPVAGFHNAGNRKRRSLAPTAL